MTLYNLVFAPFAEMIDQYHEVYNFLRNSDAFFAPLQPLIAALPTAISSCRANCPAILRIFHSLAQHKQTIGALAERTEVVCAVIRCVASSQAYFEVMRYVIDILHALLDLNGGNAIFPHSEVRTTHLSVMAGYQHYKRSRPFTTADHCKLLETVRGA
jgi:hypothetical protein